MLDLQLCQYESGDIFMVENMAFDPLELWGADVESYMGGASTVRLGDTIVAAFGWAPFMRGVVGSFAAVDRLASAGHGRELAAMVRGQTLLWMGEHAIHRAEAVAPVHDRTAHVFLRAIGYRKECVLEAAAPDATDLVQFKFIKR